MTQLRHKMLGVFSITMMNVIAVDSLRTLPFSASLGFSLIFYYLLAAIGFLLPSAYVTIKLVSNMPKKGGTYVWVREAFGDLAAFISIWFQWIYNLVWFPSILSFLAATFACLIYPSLVDNKRFMFLAVMLFFWSATLLNCFSLRVSAFLSTLGAIFGTLIPMLLLIVLGAILLNLGIPSQISWTMQDFFPDLTSLTHQTYFIAILFGLLGLESSAVHADQVSNPAKTYPRAIFISAMIIMFSLILSSLAIAVIVPPAKLNVITALTDAFNLFLLKFHLTQWMPLITLLILLGGVACITIWVINPTKALMTAADDGVAPLLFSKTNRYGAPIHLLLLQACITSLFSLAFIFMPSVSSAYWLLTAMTAQFAMLFYIIFFSAALYLTWQHKLRQTSRLLPGLAALGIITCLFAFVLGFIPPADIPVGNIYIYEAFLLGAMFLFTLPPFIFYHVKKSSLIPFPYRQ